MYFRENYISNLSKKEKEDIQKQLKENQQIQQTNKIVKSKDK